MLKTIAKMFSGDRLKEFERIVSEINAREPEFEKLSQDAMRERVAAMKQRVGGDTANLDRELVEVFALVREAAKRTLRQRHFDVQLMGGVALHRGMIVEMGTGEGKTIVATLPAALNALCGKSVHIVTVNDYLARRDAVWMGQVYDYLGLSVGVIAHEESFLYDPYFTDKTIEEERAKSGSFRVFQEFLRPVSRQEAYVTDITHGTNHEFGFDYLRDNLQVAATEVVQREHFFAIVDEVDSILIDEARTPLIISGMSRQSGEAYLFFDKLARKFSPEDYEIDEKRRSIHLADSGLEKLTRELGYDPYAAGNLETVHHLEEALRANYLFHRDKDYVVKDGQAIIVDQFTGRLMHGRRWSDGLHQAVEAKERVPIEPETRTVASISIQNYFRKYRKLVGMTGTAMTSAEEFAKVYGAEVIRIPTNKPMIRNDLPDAIFRTKDAKWRAVVRKVKECHERGQPVLLGTLSIENNEKISQMLTEAGVPHRVLNAKQHEEEGAIIAQAGKLKAVTVATNMAGRGVDIILGGNPPDAEEAERVKSLGGLMVIGTERHESKRIDNQLKGRAGRQGDIGTTQILASLEDDLIRVFGGDQVKGVMEKFNFPEDEPIEHSFLTKVIDEAQAKVEGINFDARKYVLEYDDVANMQRDKIYHMRSEILLGRTDLLIFVDEAFRSFLTQHPISGDTHQQDAIKFTFNLVQAPENEEEVRKSFDAKLDHLRKHMGDRYDEFLRMSTLRILDDLWSEHLDWLEGMRDSVGLRTHGQKEPLTEFKRETIRAFKNFEDLVRFNVLNFLSRVEARGAVPPAARTSAGEKISRNDPCPCGSGKKWKKCGLPDTEEHRKFMKDKEKRS